MNASSLSTLFIALAIANAQDPKPPTLTPDEQKLADEAKQLMRESIQLYGRGNLPTAKEKLESALEIHKRLYTAEKYPNGHKDYAEVLNNLGAVMQGMGRPDLSAQLLKECVEMNRKLYPASAHPDGHPEIVKVLGSLAAVMQASGDLPGAAKCCEEALAMCRRLYPATKFPDGHPDSARMLTSLGSVWEAMGRPEKASDYYEQGLGIRRKLYPPEKFPNGHPELARSFNNLGSAALELGQAEKAEGLFKDALAIRQKLYPSSSFPNGHPDLCTSLSNLASTYERMGHAEKALPMFEQVLDMFQKIFSPARYPRGHPLIAHSMTNLGGVHQTIGNNDKALNYTQKALEIRRQIYPATTFPEGHPDLAASLNLLGNLYYTTGQHDRALAAFLQGYEMRRKLYSGMRFSAGHPDIATSLKNIGTAYESLGHISKSIEFCEQALAMQRRLYSGPSYPNGHPNLAASQCHLGALFARNGMAAKGIETFEEGLKMLNGIYPKTLHPLGHPDLALALNNLGGLWRTIGDNKKTLAAFTQSLEMSRRLYPVEKFPEGHTVVFRGLLNTAVGHLALGESTQAAPLLREALTLHHRLLSRQLTMATEDTALSLVSTQPLVRDAYLSATRADKPVSTTYEPIWSAQARLTRVLAQRRAAAQSAGLALSTKLDSLRGMRRRTEQLLGDTRLKPGERDQLLVLLNQEKDKLEREMLEALPVLQHWQELDRLGPADLAAALPEGAVFVDLINYDRLDSVDKKENRTLCYVAFILAKNRPIRRVELNEAQPIDKAISTWRLAIDARRVDTASTTLQELLWAKLAPHLPPQTRSIYLAADGNLARLPWAALPIGKDRVLLDDYAVALVPHGVFLLDQLKFGRPIDGSGTLLTVGGIDYGTTAWSALPGTSVEVKAVAAAAPGECDHLDARHATPDKILERIVNARYVHLATHGEFRAKELAAERKRALDTIRAHQFGDDVRKIAANHPLGFVGIVVSEGKVVSGLSIVDLNLKRTKMVTLSACETGLGEYTAGEGVQGLQRAFHLAGCPNVVASLWKVNDAATAALMAKFYHELWVNKKPPIEALRTAQLTIYYHPESIPVLAKADRGAPDFKRTIEVDMKPELTPRAGKRTDTKLWAAFVLSGVGK